MSSDPTKVYERLGWRAPTGGTTGVSEVEPGVAFAHGASTDLPPLDRQGVDRLAQALESDPDEVLERAREAWDAEITLAELWNAIQRARAALDHPEAFFAAYETEAAFASTSDELPEGFEFPGMDLNDIQIKPSSHKFETKGDVLGWILFGSPFLIKSIIKRAPFRWHDEKKFGPFTYPLQGPGNKPIRVALFSDFGTGLYHSRYIAKQIQALAPHYAIHLGDVYYAGRKNETQDHLIRPLAPLVNAGIRLFLCNANHEMYSGSWPYFTYLDAKWRDSPNTQEQRGSYFQIQNTKFQLVGIDTAYHRNARHKESKLQDWLRNVLTEGRDAGKVNVLLSQHPPYAYGSAELCSLLSKDLRGVADEGLIDLWFWGDTHYCAFFDRTSTTPFLGSCIGHGGYPYELIKAGEDSPSQPVFLEKEGRFPGNVVRPDMGNNGFCMLELRPDGSIGLRYVDWMRNKRFDASLRRMGNERHLLIERRQEYPFPSPIR